MILLPSGGESRATNTGQFIIKGTANKSNIIDSYLARPLDGNKGGNGVSYRPTKCKANQSINCKTRILTMDGKSKYSGMTVNERLYISGLIDKYYEAVREKDIDAAISILKAVDLGEDNIMANLKFAGLISDD